MPNELHLKTRCVISFAVTALFCIVYFGTLFLADSRETSDALAFDWERTIPELSLFWYVYVSLFPLMYLPCFLLRTADELRCYAKACTLAIAIAGVIFVLSPHTVLYPHADAIVDASNAGWPSLLIRYFDLPYNTFPSLHVALSTICAGFLQRIWPAYRNSIVLWAILVYLSVLFTHQHHLLDIFGGAVLGLLVSSEARALFQIRLSPHMSVQEL